MSGGGHTGSGMLDRLSLIRGKMKFDVKKKTKGHRHP